MNDDSILVTPEMATVLRHLKQSGSLTIDELAEITKLPHAKVEQLTLRLSKDNLISREVRLIKRILLTEEGHKVLNKGLPEDIILDELNNKPDGIPIAELTTVLGLSKKAVNAGVGNLRKLGIIKINKGVLISGKQVSSLNPSLKDTLKSVSKDPLYPIPKDILTVLSNRGFIVTKERHHTSVQITKSGSKALTNIQIIEPVSHLTPDQIRSGQWRSLQLKSYNITSRPKTYPVGRKHPYLMFLDEVKQKLIGLGFAEMRGPLVESEFWNFDALFQAQDHSAREWSDVYTIKHPTHGSLPKDKEIVENVKRVHETGEPTGSRGWRYRWDPKKAAQLILRPQGTAVSARTLYQLKIPAKYFCIARCYRPDSVDAVHLSEFNQLEGISCDPSITFRTLLGLLKTFATEIAGATKVRFKPDYYPFTSPSAELSAYHPQLGYIEFGGSGIFRPEVTAPFGITDPVIAWGLGVDRLYMVKRGINDIRELFTQNLNWLRTVPLT
ncbi:MAG: phenylalanine--tRNA ligase subunit alpha [Candidatus Thorarchaeota archaeon]